MYSDQLSRRAYLEILEGVASVPWLGFKPASSTWVRKTIGLPGLSGRGRNILSIMLLVLGEMVKAMLPDRELFSRLDSYVRSCRSGKLSRAAYLSVQSRKDLRENSSGTATSKPNNL